MKKIGVLGTGVVGHSIGTKLIELGHEVRMGSRTTNNEKALAWVKLSGEKASNGTFESAASFGEIIFNATQGANALNALNMAGEKNLNEKILIDIANPLDFSKGMPPVLLPELSNANSLGEEIQKRFPGVKLVKALNTMWSGLMVNPALIYNGDHNTFICGNDAEAKETVKEILKSFGWVEKNILDLGDIVAARGTEMYLPLWLRIYSATNNGAFNVKIVR